MAKAASEKVKIPALEQAHSEAVAEHLVLLRTQLTIQPQIRASFDDKAG
jgi:hypothetical protein